jgi:uncharacterized protein (DUF488 family)
MEQLLTIGYTRKSLQRFVELLRGAGVDAVIDTRRHNTSQLAGFAKREDLAYLLREGFGIGYEHRLELAPTAEILARYRQDRDWPAYVQAFEGLMEETGMAVAARAVLAPYRRPCLLCAEESPERCHRRLLAERLQGLFPGLEVVHLR